MGHNLKPNHIIVLVLPNIKMNPPQVYNYVKFKK